MEIQIYLSVTPKGSNRSLHVVKFIFSSILILFSLQKNSCFFTEYQDRFYFVLQENFLLVFWILFLGQILCHLTQQFVMQIFPKLVYNF